MGIFVTFMMWWRSIVWVILLSVCTFNSSENLMFNRTYPHAKFGELLDIMSEKELLVYERAHKDLLELARDPPGFEMMYKLWMIEENHLLKDTMGRVLQTISYNEGL